MSNIMTGRCSKRNIQKNTGQFIVFWMSLCFLAGAAGGYLAQLATGVDAQLNAYLQGYANLLQDGSAAASILGVAAAYYRGPAAIYLLGHCRSGKFFLSVAFALEGFGLAYAVAAFSTALGRCGVLLAMSVFGLRFFVVLPCMLFLARQSGCFVSRAERGRKKAADGRQLRLLCLCPALLGLGVVAEVTFVPRLFAAALTLFDM